MSGLTAVHLNGTNGRAIATAMEEVPTVINLRGRNHRGGTTWFLVTRPPGNGTLYQYNASGPKGDPLVIGSTGAVVNDANPCADDPAWLCPRLVYEGARDWFSFPTETRDGTALHNPHDTFKFVLRAVSLTDGEVSAEATVAVQVNTRQRRAVRCTPTTRCVSSTKMSVTWRPLHVPHVCHCR